MGWWRKDRIFSGLGGCVGFHGGRRRRRRRMRGGRHFDVSLLMLWYHKVTQRFERIIYYISLLFIAVAVMYLYYRVYRDWPWQGKQIHLKLKLYRINTCYLSCSLSLSDSFGVSICTEDVVVPIGSIPENSKSVNFQRNKN